MKRVIVICEGPTEQEFCNNVLLPYFAEKNISIAAPVIKKSRGGIVSWQDLKRQINNHLKEGDSYVTMLIDYYGIRDCFCYPGWEESKKIVNKAERIHFLCNKMAEDIDDSYRHRFIPYVQLHEFEGLLFSDISVIKSNFIISDDNYLKLQNAVYEFANPEMINNGKSTAPSKRLLDSINGYDKVVFGSCLAMDITLKVIRERCPLFNEWINNLG